MESYNAFWNSLDPDTQAVIRAMDEHEGLGHDRQPDVSQALLDMLSSVYERIESVADRLSDDTEAAEQHAETMLLILSYAPNGQSYWFIQELIERQPEVYRYIYTRVLSQRPLQMHGKLLRERLLFYITRAQIVDLVFSPQCRNAVIAALQELKRA